MENINHDSAPGITSDQRSSALHYKHDRKWALTVKGLEVWRLHA